MIITTGPIGTRDAYRRYLLWPIRLGWFLRVRGMFTWGATRFFDWHGCNVGADGMEQWVVVTTLHAGPLKVYLGRAPKASDSSRCHRCGTSRASHLDRCSRDYIGLHCPDNLGLFHLTMPRVLSLVRMTTYDRGGRHIAEELMDSCIAEVRV